MSIFSILERTPSCIDWPNSTNIRKKNEMSSATAKDIVYVHLYLSNIAHFAKINVHYKNFFGTVLPPSRSCVAVGKALPGRRRVLLDCVVQRGSGDYMRNVLNNDSSSFLESNMNNPYRKFRSTLPVQSILSGLSYVSGRIVKLTSCNPAWYFYPVQWYYFQQ